MCNVVSKFSIAAGIILLATACGGDRASKDRAEALLASADSAINAGNCNLALELLDTLQARYPEQIETQKKALHKRPLAIEGMTVAELQETDSLLAFHSYSRDSLMQYFTFVNNPELVEGYYVIKEYANSSLFNRTGVEARVSPAGEFYMISSLTAKPVKHTSVTVKGKSGSATTATIDYDGERNYRSGATEMITFTGAECDTVGSFLNNIPDNKLTLTFNGASAYSITMTPNDSRSVALAYQLAKAMDASRRLTSRRSLLDRQLQLARDQAARTTMD